MPKPPASPDQASEFVTKADLPVARGGDTPETPNLKPPAFDPAKDEAVVVGSGMVSFKTGLPQNQREAVANSLLLAQLVLKKQGISPDDAQTWFHEYASVLANLGWLVETSEMTQYVSNEDGLDVHEAIIAVATVLLGPAAPAALPLIAATLKALRSMDTSTPWITLFNRESRHAQTASFQLALAEPSDDGKVSVSMMAFALSTNSQITQVLFFKVNSNDATLKRVSTVAEVNVSAIEAVQDTLRQKVSQFTSNYLSELPI
jgi:hypothetical protein